VSSVKSRAWEPKINKDLLSPERGDDEETIFHGVLNYILSFTVEIFVDIRSTTANELRMIL
jgi:hypothetical protein